MCLNGGHFILLMIMLGRHTIMKYLTMESESSYAALVGLNTCRFLSFTLSVSLILYDYFVIYIAFQECSGGG